MFLVPLESFFCFLNLVFVTNFSSPGVVSLPCKWRWHLVLVRGSKAKYFSIGFTLKINKSYRNSTYGAAKSPGLGQFNRQKFSAKTAFAWDPVRSYDWSCGKSNSSALLTGYAETGKSKNSTRKRNLKSKRTRSACVQTSDLWSKTKKHITKSCEIIPLKES
jgi:hypothetical protein